jgi:hypothetical protein
MKAVTKTKKEWIKSEEERKWSICSGRRSMWVLLRLMLENDEYYRFHVHHPPTQKRKREWRGTAAAAAAAAVEHE